MEQEHSVKSWLTAAVFEYSCKNEFLPVIQKILTDEELSTTLIANFATVADGHHGREKVKPVFLLIHMLRGLLSTVEAFATDATSKSRPWNSDSLPKIIKLLETTYEQCEFLTLKKFFSLVFQLKFLDLIHFLRLNVESSTLIRRLNIYFPRWQETVKETLEKQFSIENPKLLEKIETSYIQCRRLIFRLASDPPYKSEYMREQFSSDMEKMMTESVILIKEVITNLGSNTGLTVVEKGLKDHQTSTQVNDLGYQLLLDYLQPEASPEVLLRFLNEMESSLVPPGGGFSSCLLPFDTMSECSDEPMDSECDESGAEEDSGEKK